MKLNIVQKRILTIGLLIITAAFILWLSLGGEIFTKTQILVEKHDKVLGRTYNEWKDQFILGIDYTLLFSFIVFLITSVALFIKRNKK